MLSSVLRSQVAIAVNIEIMRAFVRLRRASVVSEKLLSVVAELAQRVDAHDSAIKSLIETIRHLVEPAPLAAQATDRVCADRVISADLRTGIR